MKTKLMNLLIVIAVLIGGCVQVIHEKTPTGSRLKINSFLNLTSFDGLYHDGEFFEVSKYIKIPSDLEAHFDPVSKKLIFKAKANKI